MKRIHTAISAAIALSLLPSSGSGAGILEGISWFEPDTAPITPAVTSYSKGLSGIAQFLAGQLKTNQRESRGDDSTVVVASIVSLENPNEANRIGLALSNSMLHALQIQGYRAIDFHLRKVMQVTQGGDFVTSNNVTELRNSFDITYMVTGTLSEHSDGLIVTLRMSDWETGVIVSTAETHLTTEEYFGLMSDMKINRPVAKVVRRNIPQPKQHVMRLRQPPKK